MDWQTVLQSIDELVFQQTGNILTICNEQFYKGSSMARSIGRLPKQRYKCTPGHVKDEGSQLWQILSEVFGEELNKKPLAPKALDILGTVAKGTATVITE